LATAVNNLIKRVPHAADLIFLFCGAVLVELGGEGVVISSPEVAQLRITMPLTEDQEQGKKIILDLPRAINLFCIQHVPALMGLCWSKKPNIHPNADTAPDPKKQEQIKEGLTQFIQDSQGKTSKLHTQIPAFLACLRAVGVAHFLAKPAHPNTPLHYFLTEMIDIPALIEDDDLSEGPPFSVPAKHFGYVLRLSEEILGPLEFPPSNEETIIPFSALRQFITTATTTTTATTATATITTNTTVTTTTKTTATTTNTTTTTTISQAAFVWSTANGDLEF